MSLLNNIDSPPGSPVGCAQDSLDSSTGQRAHSGQVRRRRPATPHSIFPNDKHFGDIWPRQKHPSLFRLAYANINGFDTEVYNNPSVTSLRQWLHEVDPDIFLGCEAQINWKKMPWEGKLRYWFRTGELQRSICGHNTHEDNLHGVRQFGGTFILVFGIAATHVVEMGTDPSGLGRWCWVRFSSKFGTSVRIFVVYRPVRQSRDHTLSTYMQHSRYLESVGDRTCPRRALLRDLEIEMHRCLVIGDKLIVAGDFNENTVCGHLHDLFVNLGFREATFHRRDPSIPLPATMSRGRCPVDAVWVSPDLPHKAASWLSFSHSPGDHRASIIDFNLEDILGELAFKVFRPGGRRLNTKLPAVVGIYNRLLEKHLLRHKFLPKLYKVATEPNWAHRWHEFAVTMESLDRIRVEGMKFAEKRCRRFHSGATFFSPEIDHWFKRRQLYSQLLQYHDGKRIRRPTIIKLAKRCHADHVFLLSRSDVENFFREADAKYRTLKPRSAELRENFLRQLLATTHANHDKQTAIRNLIRHEDQRTTARFLRQLEGAPLHCSITEVHVQSPTGDIQVLRSQQEVEQALSSCLEKRFRLTDQSPLMQAGLLTLLGNGSSTISTSNILDGQFPPIPHASAYTNWLLQGMTRPTPALPIIDISITVNDFQSYWKKAKEKTSSSLSGLHFGHYKSAASSDFLSECHAFFTEISFRTGYPLQRWQQGLQVILEKKPGVLLVSKLRAILLMEADFNFGNKLYIGARMIRNASSDIPRDLYGGVKGRRPEFMALSRRLLTDILRQKRRAGVLASVDAQSCYDRITHSTAAICCQRWGVPSRIMETMLKTIQGMKFFLRTGYGDSDKFYGGGEHLFQGICQGNGAGPAVWLAISTVLVLILHEKTEGRPIRGAITAASLVVLAFLFVDDTDLFVLGDLHTADHVDLISRLQVLIDMWQGLLHASGGSLSADKCSWSLIAFRWASGKWHYHTSSSLPAEIHVQDELGDNVVIRRIEPHDSIPIVGVEQAASGSMRGQLSLLSETIEKWGTALRQGSLPRHIAWAAIRSKIWPGLRFPLAATTLTQQEGKHLIGKLYKHLLPKLGTNRNIPAAVRYGPLTMAGLDLPEPYIYQGSKQVAHFHQLYGTNTNEGHLLRVSLEHLQLEVGLSTLVLNSDYTTFGYLATDSWMKSLWGFLSLYHIRIEVECPIPSLCRERDSYIMEAFSSCPSLSKVDIISANRCRLYLQSIVFSDLATGGGDSVLDNVFHSRRDPSRISRFEWQDERPSPQDIARWQKCLVATLSFCPLHLGRWIHDPHYTHQWWYAIATDTLYKDYKGKWWFFTLSNTRPTRSVTTFGQRYQLSGVITLPTRPRSWVRTTVHEYSDGRVSHEGYAGRIAQDPIPQPPFHNQTSFGRFIASRSQPLCPSLNTATISHHGETIAQAIARGTAHGACDGSYMPTRSTYLGTAAWIMEDGMNPGVGVCSGTVRTTGWCDYDVNAYRSELQGIYTLLLAVLAIGEMHAITTGCFTLYCDNEKAIFLSSNSDEVLPTSTAHHDLIRSIRGVHRIIPFRVQFLHVRGHQDEVTGFWSLPRPSQLNILCDNMAKQYLLQLLIEKPPAPPSSPKFVGEGPSCFLRDIKLTGNIQHRIASYCAEEAVKDYLITKGLLSHDTVHIVNWAAIGHYLRHQSVPFRLWATKHSFKFAATGQNLVRWGLSQFDSCPCCGHSPEIMLHLYQCTAEGMVANKTERLEAFTSWMESANTHPEILRIFMRVLSSDISFTSVATLETAIAARQQDALGVWNTWVGRLSISWEQLQDTYYRSISSSKTSRVWAAGMTEHILLIGHGLWVTRNRVLHDKTLGGITIHQSTELNNEISNQYALGLADLHPRDHHLITKRDLPSILKLPTAHKRLWYQSLLIARDHGRLQAAVEDNSMAGIMRRWLGRTPP